jgi:hypothetical protein
VGAILTSKDAGSGQEEDEMPDAGVFVPLEKRIRGCREREENE